MDPSPARPAVERDRSHPPPDGGGRPDAGPAGGADAVAGRCTATQSYADAVPSRDVCPDGGRAYPPDGETAAGGPARTIDADTVARRLGGWGIARDDAGVARTGDSASGSPPVDRPLPLGWTPAAFAACQRVRRLIARIDPDSERRFAAAVVAAMVRLSVEGHPDGDGSHDAAEVPLVHGLSLRVACDAGRNIVVLGVRWPDAVR